MQRTLRLPIQVSHFENGSRMIDANVRVVPEGAGRHHSKPMALRVVAHAGEQTSRRLGPSGRRKSATPIATRYRASHAIRSTDSQHRPRSAGSTTFRCVRTAIGRFRTDSALPTRQISHPSFV
ncbi:hypothetical protein [Burkholderia sp. Ac-20392]|uniref:hypothetical protein n=1 Tax=Burkholderia sp. Ac-20392 TaxID=2703905 RepID=UPI00197FDF39|nr:hypothetical protein [Burkholderia sp. Ac-20392]MBN3799094.1 hypothetical protein [Burkholderia sp. Ac-20392]